jgi:hypothetical protein
LRCMSAFPPASSRDEGRLYRRRFGNNVSWM